MKKQSYSNHKKYNALFHIVFLLIIVSLFIASLVNLINNLDEADRVLSSIILVGLSVSSLLAYYFMRIFAVRLQDRVIRSEENFRHFQLTGQPLDQKLHMSQIIALRFAPDSEFVELCKEAVEKRMTNNEIKKAISRWRGDYHRI